VSLTVAGLFVVFLAASVVSGKLPIAVLAFYLAASAIAFGAYAVDKSAARRGASRTRESTLHLLGLIGGWPGALVAQEVLRHKSQKRSFKTILWLTAALNGGALVWLFSPTGSAVLRSLLVRL
jgi:uncharacterized membrane protein YsdA (DUF1294 family)